MRADHKSSNNYVLEENEDDETLTKSTKRIVNSSSGSILEDSEDDDETLIKSTKRIVNSSSDSILEDSEDDDESITNSTKRNINNMDVSKSLKSVGKVMELYEIQLFIIALIILDLIALSVQKYMTCGSSVHNEKMNQNQHQVFESQGFERFIQTFTTFTLIMFLFEITALIIAFRKRFFSHIGYTMDAFIVLSCLLCEICDIGKMIRLLGFLRLWRIARLVSTTLNMTHSDHKKVMLILRGERIRSNKVKDDLNLTRQNLREEKEARTMVERMLQGYKDEVDTLKEALRFAAFDVAAATQEETSVEVEDNAVEVYDKNKVFEGSAAKGKKDSFIIHEDGSFESPR